MSISIGITAYSGKDSPEFKKHYDAVKYCNENGLSYPKETSEFFSGKLGGDSLEDYEPKYALEYIENGVEVPIETIDEDGYGYKIKIPVSKIPKEVDEIIVELVS